MHISVGSLKRSIAQLTAMWSTFVGLGGVKGNFYLPFSDKAMDDIVGI